MVLSFYGRVRVAGGGLLICGGLVPLVQWFVEFIKADGTPVPAASSRRLVASGPYRYVRNPVYVGFVVILMGEALMFGSSGLLEYAAGTWGVTAAAVASTRNRPWPARSEPIVSSTGVPCTPGFPGCTPGQPGRRLNRPNVLRSKTG